MKKYLTRSNIIAFMSFLILFSYIGITYYKLHKEKPIYAIGICAKDESIYDLEVKSIFHKHWLFAGHTSQIPNIGDYFLF